MSLALNGWESTRGDKSRTKSLSEAEAQQILDRKGGEQTQREVAEEFGVTAQNVGAIWRRTSWRHLRKTR